MKAINNIAKIFALAIMSAIILISANSPVIAGKWKKKQTKSQQPKLWRLFDESLLQARGAERAVTPEKYLVFRLDRTFLKNSLADLPLENTNEATEKNIVMQFPMPDGSLQKFRMEQTAVLSPELAAQYADWKTFKGYGIDDTTAVGRFD